MVQVWFFSIMKACAIWFLASVIAYGISYPWNRPRERVEEAEKLELLRAKQKEGR